MVHKLNPWGAIPLNPRFSGLLAALLCAGMALSSPQVHAAESDATSAALSALNLANHHYKAGRFKKAAGLYHEAYGIDAKAAFLFNAARAEMRAFEHGTAKKNFNRYLALADATDKGKARARAHLQEIEAYNAKLAEQQRKGKALAVTAAANARADATRPLDTLTLGLWIGTGALAVAGGSLYGVAAILRSGTNKMKIETEADKTKHDKDIASQDGLRNVSIIALLGAAGLGTWAYLRTRDLRKAVPVAGLQVSPWGDGRGLSVLGRF